MKNIGHQQVFLCCDANPNGLHDRPERSFYLGPICVADITLRGVEVICSMTAVFEDDDGKTFCRHHAAPQMRQEEQS